MENKLNIKSILFYRSVFTDYIPIAQKASLKMELIAPKMRLRRDVLFSFEDFLGKFN